MSSKERLLDFFFPKRCLGCGRVGNFVCPVCEYEKVFALVPLLVDHLFQFIEESNLILGERTTIAFVPSHQFKIFERGFNQVELLAKELSRRLNLECLPLLEKIKETPSQTSLSKEERLRNVEDSFRVKKEWVSKLEGRDILLLDDVFTTGATLLECSKVLKKSNARFIYLLTLAKD